jgi:hypothetical protein
MHEPARQTFDTELPVRLTIPCRDENARVGPAVEAAIADDTASAHDGTRDSERYVDLEGRWAAAPDRGPAAPALVTPPTAECASLKWPHLEPWYWGEFLTTLIRNAEVRSGLGQERVCTFMPCRMSQKRRGRIVC